MKQKQNYGNRRQQGIALPIVMVILVLAALVTIYTTTTSVKEQQVTADQYRSEQAFSTAQAGVDAALERHNHFEAFVDLDKCGDPVVAPAVGVPPETNIESGCENFAKGSYTVMFCDIWDDGDETANDDTDEDGTTGASLMKDFLTDIDSCSNPINIADADEPDGFKNDERVGILSVGKPDDNSGRRTVSVVSAPALLFNDEGPPEVPLTARGSFKIGANITLINRYENINVWAGDPLDMNSAAISTYINDGTAVDRVDLIYDPGVTPSCAETIHKGILASCDKVGSNSDILDNDSNLKSISDIEMFKRIFSASRDEIRALAIEAGKFYTDDTFQAELNKPDPLTGLIWLEVSAGNMPDIDVGFLDEANNYLNDAPAFLVIDVVDSGIVKIGGGDAFGLVFIFGSVQFVGNPTVTGTVIVTENVEKSTGTPTIINDPSGTSVSPEGLGGLRGIEPGTWKDWGYVN